MTETETINNRLNTVKRYFMSNQRLLVVLLLAIVLLGTYIRTLNTPLLEDRKLIGLDPYIFYRWAGMIVDNGGSLPQNDPMRAYPVGFNIRNENTLLSYLLAYPYMIIHALIPSITLLQVTIWAPPVMFFISMIFFYLFIKKLLDGRVALLATALLVVNRAYIFRTIAGFTDKENPGMMFFFIGLYLFINGFDKTKSALKMLVYSALAGLAFGCMGWSWGASTMVYFIIGAAALVKFMLDFDVRQYASFSVIMVIMSAILLTTGNGYGGWPGGLKVLATSFTSIIALLALAYGLVLLLLNRLKQRIGQAFPLVCLLLTISMGIAGLIIMDGFHIIPDMGTAFVDTMITPFGTARHALTVAEYSHPYFVNWKSEFGIWILWFALLGAVLVFYNMVKSLNGRKWIMTAAYACLIAAFIFTRYSPDTIMDGVSGLSVLLYLGTGIAFIALVVIGYYRLRNNTEMLKQIHALDFNLLFVVVWFMMMTVAARGAVRMFFIMTPVMTTLAAYTLVFVYDQLGDWFYKAIPVAVALLLVGTSIVPAMNIASGMVDVTPQWDAAMTWVRDETPKDAIFAHWWDYGYWVQGIGERTTVLDGGQPQPAWNYYMGRNVLTGRSEQEALDFLYAHNVSYLLIDPTDIGKYNAYSFIGSNTTYDRQTYIPNMGLRGIDGERHLWVGQVMFDTDWRYNGRYFMSGQDYIQGVDANITNDTVLTQPSIIVTDGSSVPLQCIHIADKEFRWPDGYPGCAVVLPSYKDNALEYPYAILLFLTEKSEPSLMTRMYIRNEAMQYFTPAYRDSTPLALYNGQLIGPVVIWKVTYPANQTYYPQYIAPEFPEGTFYK